VWLTFLGLCILGIILGRVQNQARQAGSRDVLTQSIQRVVTPPASGIQRLAQSTSDFFLGVFQSGDLVRQNRSLRQMEQAAAMYSENEKRLIGELDALRKLVQLPPIEGRGRISATNIGLFPYENRMTISAGSRQGVKVGLAVVNGSGLVGVVQTVGPNDSQIALVESPSFRIGAMALRQPPQPGILRSQGSGRLVLDFLSIKSPLQEGDFVVTSGFSPKIPRGIPIGRVLEIEDDPDFGIRRARVFPHVRIGEVREVFVIR